jgi:hypothetical protein
VFYPADVVKVRLQTAAAQPAAAYVSATSEGGDTSSSDRSKGVTPPSVWSLAKTIWREEGPSGLFANGVVAGNCRALIYQGLRLGLFPSFKRALIGAMGGGGGLGPRMLAGMGTGALGALLTSPLDLAKVRMMAQQCTRRKKSGEKSSGERTSSRPHKDDGDATTEAAAIDSVAASPSSEAEEERGSKYANSFDALFTIAREEGLGLRIGGGSGGGLTGGSSSTGGGGGGLWQASGASVLRSAMASGAQLGAYDAAKAFCATVGLASSHPAAASAVASQLAAVAYTTAAAPFDLIKNRLMAHRASSSSSHSNDGGRRQQQSVVSLVVQVIRTEGLAALWRGWLPATLSLMPVVMIVFPLMELLRSLMGIGTF